MDIQITGSSANRVDLVFVAEGYTESQMAQFYVDAQALTEQMFNASALNQPYGTYQNYFNVRALFVASNDSGYTTDARSVDTYFDASASLSDGRGISGNANTVRRFINQQLPDVDKQDIVVVLVNTSDYGGSATGDITWVSARNTHSSEVLLHEVGHSFAGLDDEYVDAQVASAFPLTSTALADSVHLSLDRNDVPWTAWLGYRDSLGVVGSYEGGYYRSTGVWRATSTSKMREYDQPFSAPQKEAIVHAIYDTVGDSLSVSKLTPYVYDVQAIDSNLVQTQWQLDGVTTSGYGLGTLTTYGLQGQSLVAQGSDTGGFVRVGLENLTSSVAIDLQAPPSVAFATLDQLDAVQDRVITFSSGNDHASVSTLQDNFLDFGLGSDVLSLAFTSAQIQLQTLSDQVLLISGEDASASSHSTPSHLAAAGLERLTFADARAFAIEDMLVDQAYRLYQAAFARTPDDEGLGYWVAQMDRGATLKAVAQGFVQSAEFIGLYGDQAATESFVNGLYRNVLGRLPDEEGATFWVDHMLAGRLLPNEVLVEFSESVENVRNLQPTLSQGVWYDTWA